MPRSRTLALEAALWGLAAALIAARPVAAKDELVYIGTHGTQAPGPSGQAAPTSDAGPQGIYGARLDVRTGHLSAPALGIKLERATWLLTHPKLPILYSVASSGEGLQANSDIYSLSVDPASGKLRTINKVDAGGRDATALDLDAHSSSLLAANYGSGSVTALPILSDGSLGPVASSQSETGSGPSPRQKTAHAHDVTIDPSHEYVLVADFGADRVFVYHFDGSARSLTPADVPSESLPAGSGPRRLVFHPAGRFALLNTELTAELRSYRWDSKAGRLDLVQTLAAYPDGHSGEKSAGELALSRDGRFAYLSLRGDQDSIVVYAFDARKGTLAEIQRISAQGKSPWSFGLDPSGRWMLVTNEVSNSVVVLKVDPGTGKLTATGEFITVPKPVTVSFYAN
jgi:6-phosphogluconolactonase